MSEMGSTKSHSLKVVVDHSVAPYELHVHPLTLDIIQRAYLIDEDSPRALDGLVMEIPKLTLAADPKPDTHAIAEKGYTKLPTREDIDADFHRQLQRAKAAYDQRLYLLAAGLMSGGEAIARLANERQEAGIPLQTFVADDA